MRIIGVAISLGLAAAIFVGSGLYHWAKTVPLDQAGPQALNFARESTGRVARAVEAFRAPGEQKDQATAELAEAAAPVVQAIVQRAAIPAPAGVVAQAGPARPQAVPQVQPAPVRQAARIPARRSGNYQARFGPPEQTD
ncbi:MAG: hypothetical protein BIFFINMI_02196 [Phycisphaerae bacterium]|nr:hypothetical protein [Phycisphaerae bacterium]